VIVIVEHGPAALHDAVERPRYPNAEPLHAPRKRAVGVCFHQEVQVIAEHGELDNAKPEALAGAGEALFYRAEAAAASKVPDSCGDSERDEHYRGTIKKRARFVGNSGPLRGPLASGALSFPASLRNLQSELLH
jgi:hypothetical protein